MPASLQEEQRSAAMVELRELKTAVADTEPVGPLLACARTLDQLSAVSKKQAKDKEHGKYKRALGLGRSRAGEGRSNQYVTLRIACTCLAC